MERERNPGTAFPRIAALRACIRATQLVDVEKPIDEAALERLRGIEGVLAVRVL